MASAASRQAAKQRALESVLNLFGDAKKGKAGGKGAGGGKGGGKGSGGRGGKGGGRGGGHKAKGGRGKK